MDARRIALVKPSALGDVVHALPVLTALRERFPAARITWVINSAYEPLVRYHPDLTDTLPFDRGVFRRGIWKAARHLASFAAELRRRQFDLVIDLQGLFRSGLMCLATGSPRRVGFADAREGSRYCYTHKVRAPGRDEVHAVDRNWAVAEWLGAGDGPKRFRVPVDAGEVQAARDELAGLPRPWVAVAAGAKWVTKRWPAGHFAELLRRTQARFGGTCLFVGTADDITLSLEVMRGLGTSGDPTPNPLPRGWRGLSPAPPSLGGQGAGGLGSCIRDLTGRTTLPRLAALLSLCDVMVGNDTGPLHLAAALGRPCVAPYTCTRVALHGPYTSMAGGVETRVPCAGSYLKTCDKMICMPELTPDRLWPRLAEVLDTWQRNSRSA
jgi:ADP-heptose:LPS heptosyltransferase